MKKESHLYLYGNKSLANIAQCKKPLQDVLLEHSKHFNSSVVCGHRPKIDQMKAFYAKVSKLQWPDSKHNSTPSNAFDIYPWHDKYKSLTEDNEVINRIVAISGCSRQAALNFIRTQYYMQAQSIMISARIVGVELRWGGDWDSDLDFLDQTFNDLAHFELA